jgi:hypothetical protein
MAEAIISRRGGAVFEEEVHTSAWYTLTSPFLIGAKNALIGLCPNPQYGMTTAGAGVIVSVEIKDGEVASAYCLYKDSTTALIHPIHDLLFDSLTGTLSKSANSLGEFSPVMGYKLVVY